MLPLLYFVFFLSSKLRLCLQFSLETHRSPNTNDQMSELSTSPKNRDKNHSGPNTNSIVIAFKNSSDAWNLKNAIAS